METGDWILRKKRQTSSNKREKVERKRLSVK
jgi:hypothetical protein